MTKEEMEKITDEKGITMKAKDIVPGLYLLPCQFENGQCLLNLISLSRWSEDGNKIVWMLDSHNFHFIGPEDERIVVKHRPGYITNTRVQEYIKRHTELMAVPPKERGKRN